MKRIFTGFMRTVYFIGVILAVFSVVFLYRPKSVYAATQIQETSADTNVFPDKYNTNPTTPKAGFTTIEKGSTISVVNTDGVPMNIKFQSGQNQEKINLAYANKDLQGTIVFENYDFSTIGKLVILDVGSREASKKPVNFVFKNCKFDSFSCPREQSLYVTYTFERCSFKTFFGSNASFERCYFGGGIQDRIIPFCHINLNNCYIANPTSEESNAGEIHVDGTQIYAWDSTEAYDIHFSGCRFEMPSMKYPNAAKTYVNACIMLSLEYNSGHDISFTDCYLNGGGMSVYAGTKYEQLTLSNVEFKNLTFGCAQKYGWLYPRYSSSVALNQDTWKSADSIYVSSVWRDIANKQTNIVVTNDTNQTRTFVVFTPDGSTYNFEIEACPLYKDFGNKKFEDLPFDKVYTIPKIYDWIVCYETTGGTFKQVRYENWTSGNLVAIKKDDMKIGYIIERPKGTPVKKLTRRGRNLTVRWKSRKGKVTGYQIQYSTSPKFTRKTSKIIVVRNSKKTSYTIRNLKRNKQYYVRMRTYRNRKIDKDRKNIYSGWSKYRKITIK